MDLQKQLNKTKKLSKEMFEIRSKILKYEENVKKRECELWLESDWCALLDKDRPTEKDKTFFMTNDKKILFNKRKLKTNKAKLEQLKNDYEIEMLILKYIIETDSE